MCRAIRSKTTAMANRTRVISNSGIRSPCSDSAGDLGLTQPRRCPWIRYAIKWR